ncbi:MAG: hypothetical protein L6R39_003208 [Caloplaca ligustica]|nr:MAG: hypothetical protein L6R39_003208 [Caloplaca ligustica]
MTPSSNSDNGIRDPESYEPPSTILVVGAGVFGRWVPPPRWPYEPNTANNGSPVSITLAILSSPTYSRTHVTLVDPNLPSTADRAQNDNILYSPSSNTASIDSSRIIRPDYANPAYASLAAEAQEAWRQGFGGEDVYHESGLVVVAGKGGSHYVEAAYRNVKEAPNKHGVDQSRARDLLKRRKEVERLGGPEEIRAVAGLPPMERSHGFDEEEEHLGSTGYINHASGWANPEQAIQTVMQRIFSYAKTNRLTLKRGHVEQLLFVSSSNNDKTTVTGVSFTNSSNLRASLTILATGAWTPSLLDLRGRVQATGQVVAYLPLTVTEAHELRDMPVLLNLSTGHFVIPPAKNASSPTTSALSSQSPSPRAEWNGDGQYTHHIKIARHAHGYLNPTPITLSLPAFPGSSSKIIHIFPSVPSPPSPSLPPSALTGLGTFQRRLFPCPSHALHSRPFSSTRLCWYSDTPTGDFLVTYHPDYEGLFLATGGSGHGFKFLPVLGQKVIDVLQGKGEEWAEMWRWRERMEEEEWKSDGSRGGKRGEVLVEAMEGGKSYGDERRSKL